jgi:hypothetical protein
MHKIHLLGLVQLFLSFSASAQFVVTNIEQRAKVRDLLHSNETMLRKGVVNSKVSLKELGHQVSPFFEVEDGIKVIFEKQGSCHQIKIANNLNEAKKINCHKTKIDFQLKDLADFKLVSPAELLDQGLRTTSFGQERQTFIWKAFVHNYSIYLEDLAITQKASLPYPHRDLPLQIEASSKVSLSENEFKVDQVISLTAAALSVQSEKTVKRDNKINLTKRDLLFSNGNGEVILYKEHVQNPFAQTYINLNPLAMAHLQAYEQKSLETQNGVCFRDDHVRRSEFDCHALIFKQASIHTQSNFSLLKVNFDSKTIEVLE